MTDIERAIDIARKIHPDWQVMPISDAKKMAKALLQLAEANEEARGKFQWYAIQLDDTFQRMAAAEWLEKYAKDKV